MFIIPLLRQDLTKKDFLSLSLPITDSNTINQSFLTQKYASTPSRKAIIFKAHNYGIRCSSPIGVQM